ncbi:MAG: hypothetical protein WC488_04715 [Candidatus Micrarchaeia archaeon]
MATPVQKLGKKMETDAKTYLNKPKIERDPRTCDFRTKTPLVSPIPDVLGVFRCKAGEGAECEWMAVDGNDGKRICVVPTEKAMKEMEEIRTNDPRPVQKPEQK